MAVEQRTGDAAARLLSEKERWLPGWLATRWIALRAGRCAQMPRARREAVTAVGQGR
jgi:hypothetical protein